MIKGTPELIEERREVIINACEKLYESLSFKDITMKEIGNAVPFSRPTIYNYFQTKEEIFLALFKREYDLWNDDLQRIKNENTSLSREQIAEKISRSLEKRVQLLKLLSMNNYDMEANSREEMLTSFKFSFGKSIELVREIIRKFRTEMAESEIASFIYTFFPFMFGIYPYVSVTDKQRIAMKNAGVDFSYQSVYELTYNCITKLLKNN